MLDVYQPLMLDLSLLLLHLKLHHQDLLLNRVLHTPLKFLNPVNTNYLSENPWGAKV